MAWGVLVPPFRSLEQMIACLWLSRRRSGRDWGRKQSPWVGGLGATPTAQQPCWYASAACDAVSRAFIISCMCMLGAPPVHRWHIRLCAAAVSYKQLVQSSSTHVLPSCSAFVCASDSPAVFQPRSCFLLQVAFCKIGIIKCWLARPHQYAISHHSDIRAAGRGHVASCSRLGVGPDATE